MARSMKPKTVSWPPDVNLCQVQLFSSEDAPSLVGSGFQGHFQAKSSWILTESGSDNNLPLGFEAPWPSMHMVPLIKWSCPPTLVLDPAWQVVAGEESREVEAQKQREMRVLEAVYPRSSVIPPSPSLALGAYGCQIDDIRTPLIPLTPVEDDHIETSQQDPSIIPYEPQEGSSSNTFTETGTMEPSRERISSILEKSQVNSLLLTPRSAIGEKPALEFPYASADVIAAASTALTAIMKTEEAGSLIDHDLLIKILSNPKLIDQLVKGSGSTTKVTQHTTNSSNPPFTSSATVSVPTEPVNISRREVSAATLPLTGTLFPLSTFSSNLYTVSLGLHPPTIPQRASTATLASTLAMNDMNYYKSLIQQHGGEQQQTQDQAPPQFGQNLQNPKARGKIQKPCVYFNTPKGCRHGVDCSYLHDSSIKRRVGSICAMPSAKRLKLDGRLQGGVE